MTNKLETETFFSICLPTYNRAFMMRKAIESVITQNYSNYDFIICDNASTDDTEAVVKSYNHPKIKYYRYDSLVSMYGNHNRCLEQAQSDWILFLHSDDEFIDISIANKIIQKNSFKEGIYIPSYPPKDELGGIKTKNFVDLFSNFNGSSPSGTIYSKRLLIELGGFREDNIIADWEMLLDASLSGYGIFEFVGRFIRKVHHPQQATYDISKTGENHLAKTYCIDRIISKVQNVEDFLTNFTLECSPEQVMLLYRYLEHAGHKDNLITLREIAKRNNKFNIISVDYFHSQLNSLIGLKMYIKIFQIIKNIEYKLRGI